MLWNDWELGDPWRVRNGTFLPRTVEYGTGGRDLEGACGALLGLCLAQVGFNTAALKSQLDVVTTTRERLPAGPDASPDPAACATPRAYLAVGCVFRSRSLNRTSPRVRRRVSIASGWSGMQTTPFRPPRSRRSCSEGAGREPRIPSMGIIPMPWDCLKRTEPQTNSSARRSDDTEAPPGVASGPLCWNGFHAEGLVRF